MRGHRPCLWILQVLYENDYNGACSKNTKSIMYEVLRKKVYFANYKKTVIIILYNTVISESTFKTCMCIRFYFWLLNFNAG